MSKRKKRIAKWFKGGKIDPFGNKIKILKTNAPKKKKGNPKKKKPTESYIPPIRKRVYESYVQESSFVTLEVGDGSTFKISFSNVKADKPKIQKEKGKVNPIFVGSPLAKGLIGKKKGDSYQVSKLVSYKIIEIINALIL